MTDNTPIRAVVAFAIQADNQAATALCEKLQTAATPDLVQSLTISRDGGLTLTFELADHDALDKATHALGPIIGELSEQGARRSVQIYGELDPKAQAAFQRFRPTMHAFAR